MTKRKNIIVVAVLAFLFSILLSEAIHPHKHEHGEEHHNHDFHDCDDSLNLHIE